MGSESANFQVQSWIHYHQIRGGLNEWNPFHSRRNNFQAKSADSFYFQQKLKLESFAGLVCHVSCHNKTCIIPQWHNYLCAKNLIVIGMEINETEGKKGMTRTLVLTNWLVCYCSAIQSSVKWARSDSIASLIPADLGLWKCKLSRSCTRDGSKSAPGLENANLLTLFFSPTFDI